MRSAPLTGWLGNAGFAYRADPPFLAGCTGDYELIALI
jgi:hypothetical protein